jgi:formylglycine-generating enzyme required for sulfatase activity
VRLLLDFEWEKAASWDERRQVKQRYLWGDDLLHDISRRK